MQCMPTARCDQPRSQFTSGALSSRRKLSNRQYKGRATGSRPATGTGSNARPGVSVLGCPTTNNPFCHYRTCPASAPASAPNPQAATTSITGSASPSLKESIAPALSLFFEPRANRALGVVESEEFPFRHRPRSLDHLAGLAMTKLDRRGLLVEAAPLRAPASEHQQDAIEFFALGRRMVFVPGWPLAVTSSLQQAVSLHLLESSVRTRQLGR